MPQMKPMNWLFLFFYSFFLFIMMNNSLYFFLVKEKKSLTNKNIYFNKFNFKW
uniref:ATP synthase F0 subunit 8 n=1 Tax=Dryocosmus liui TaxID=2315263 RepID=UPI0022648E5F|nr:ATP synthase F0 subunit 8 [Dryocosmus liui]UEE83316.1 ATP synthase F0 subunit 8 [Dryocosmus liui]